MKVNNTNEELFDGLFKQNLGSASSPVPAGVWENISSSIGSGANIAGIAAKTAIWMKAAMGAALILGISAAVYLYKESPEDKTILPNQVPIVANGSKTQQENTDAHNADLNQKEQKEQIESDRLKPIEYVIINEHDDYVQDDFDLEMPPPSAEIDYNKVGTLGPEDKQEKKAQDNIESDDMLKEEPQAVFLNDASIKDSSYIEVPTAFTNDGDGINDTYQIKLIGEERVEIIIYTADNQIVFRTNNKYIGWDSRMPNGELAPEGFYFVKVIYKYKNKAESSPIIRRITLIR